MKYPTFPELNYAMHILASSFVELFPNLQLLDFAIFPDRFCIDFSFARKLSPEEIQMLKDRFFLKIGKKEKGDIREMVSKNACDMLKHHKQLFLTELIDKEETFTPMICMSVYNAPIVGEIDQEAEFKSLNLKLNDLGEKKWMSRRVHHYSVEGFAFYSEYNIEPLLSQLHEEIGKKEALFWVEGGKVAFSSNGEKKFEALFPLCSKYFGEKVYFEFEPAEFVQISGIKNFYVYFETPGVYDGIAYGLKETDVVRSIMVYSYSEVNLSDSLTLFVSELGLTGQFDKYGMFLVYDYKGIPWVVAKNNDDSESFSIEVDLQCLFALMLEKRMQ